MLTDAALNYLKMGFRPIRLREGSKAAEIFWKEYQSRPPGEEEVRRMFASGSPNIGLVTGNGLVVVDVDDPALLEAVIEHVGSTPMMCRTPSGGTHLYFRMRGGVHYGNAVRINDRATDLRCEGAYAVCPWSQNQEGAYRWIGDVLPASDLPLPRISWLREKKPARKMQPVEMTDEAGSMEKRAIGWLSHVEGAISGANGHKATMRVAGKLIQFFRLDFETALRCMKVWNGTCEPEWSETELCHKLRSAVKNMDKYIRENP